MSDEDLTTSEAAAKLGVSRRRVQQLIRDNILPARRFGLAFVVRESDLSKARRRKTAPGPEPKKNRIPR